MVTSHYDVLGVPTTADPAAIRAAFRRLARQTHPDVGGDPAEFAAVALAWAILSDPIARARHDAELAGGDEVGWGEELGLDEPAPEPTPEPAPEPMSAPPPRRHVDPFSSPPLALPQPDTSGVVRSYPRPLGGWAFLAYGAVVLLAMVVFGVFHDRAPISSAAFTGLAAFSLLLVATVALRSVPSGRAFGVFSAVVLYGLVLGFGLGGSQWIGDALTDQARTTRVAIVVAGVALSLGVAAVVEVRRSRVQRVIRELLHVYDEAAAARRWNVLLRELDRTAGTVLVDGSLVPPGRRRPERGWAVVDAAGVAYAVATEADREAWCAALRAAGADVAATTAPRTGTGTTADPHAR